jgi:hypothetical protein
MIDRVLLKKVGVEDREAGSTLPRSHTAHASSTSTSDQEQHVRRALVYQRSCKVSS